VLKLMQVTVDTLAGLPLFKLSGEFDHAAAPEVNRVLEEELPETIETGVLIDLADVPYVDSAGLGVLSKMLARCRGEGWIGIISPAPNVFRLFEIAGITTRQSMVVLKDEGAVLGYLEDLAKPKPKRERPRRHSLLEGEEDWDDDEGEPGEDDEEPLWEAEESPSWEDRRKQDW
jgi:anti-anti-sigma factor